MMGRLQPSQPLAAARAQALHALMACDADANRRLSRRELAAMVLWYAAACCTLHEA